MRLGIVKSEEIKVGERFRKEYGDLTELAKSFEIDGVIQPLAVKATPDSDRPYYLLAGGRRLAAMKLTDLVEVPVRIYDRELSELEMRSIELMENILRKDLSYAEDCAIKREIKELQEAIHGRKISTSPDASGTSDKETAELLRVSTGTFSQDIQLARAIEVFPELGECKNKAEAQKLLKNLQADVVKDELLRRIREAKAETPIARLKEELCNRFIVRDFFEGVKEVPDQSIDLVEVDPPYGIDLTDKKKSMEGVPYYDEDSYNEVDAKDYLPFLDRTVKECYRVMAEHSWLIFWFGHNPWFEDTFQILIRNGFDLKRMPAVWTKPTGQTTWPDRNLGSAYEMFFYARKGTPGIVRQGRSNVFDFKPVPPSKKIHPTERPIEMMAEIVSTFAGEGSRVLVPFLGSGNTILAASNLGMNCFGFELSKSYKDSFTVRVHEGDPQEYRSY